MLTKSIFCRAAYRRLTRARRIALRPLSDCRIRNRSRKVQINDGSSHNLDHSYFLYPVHLFIVYPRSLRREHAGCSGWQHYI